MISSVLRSSSEESQASPRCCTRQREKVYIFSCCTDIFNWLCCSPLLCLCTYVIVRRFRLLNVKKKKVLTSTGSDFFIHFGFVLLWNVTNGRRACEQVCVSMFWLLDNYIQTTCLMFVFDLMESNVLNKLLKTQCCELNVLPYVCFFLSVCVVATWRFSFCRKRYYISSWRSFKSSQRESLKCLWMIINY